MMPFSISTTFVLAFGGAQRELEIALQSFSQADRAFITAIALGT